jgi:AraC-like DNA-binding protein/AmiR/NasT family two-component response regulator
LKKYILIFSNDDLSARLIKSILVNDGHEIYIENISVVKNIETLEKRLPNLLIIDFNSKNINDGIALGKHLLLKDNIPYIFISSLSDSVTLSKISNTRPHGYLLKPLRPIELTILTQFTINNFFYRNIDVLRNGIEIKNEIPFILKKVIIYIDENINEKIEINDLAALTKWKSQYFQRLFSKYIGINPHEYIVKKKMQNAMNLIVDTEIPIKQISYELGFLSHSNFCINFKKITNNTPKKYRIIHKVRSEFI